MPAFARPALVLGAVLVAGCLAPSSPDAPGGGPDAADWALTGTACRELIVLVPVDKAAAQALLPAEYVASDAGVVFGAPVATGSGLLALANMDCAEGNLTRGGATERAFFHLGEYIVVIEPPEGAPAGAALYAYEFGTVLSDATVSSTLSAWGWPSVEGVVSRQTQAPPGLGRPTAYDQVWTTTDHAYGARGAYAAPDSPGPPAVTYVYRGEGEGRRVLTFEGDFAISSPGPASVTASAGSEVAVAAGERSGGTTLYATVPSVVVRPWS